MILRNMTRSGENTKMAIKPVPIEERNCERCIHKVSKVSRFGTIYACEVWMCKPEYRDDSDKRDDYAC